MSIENKKIISRLILQKILSSSATKWMKTVHFESVSNAFLSDDPEREVYITYILKKPGVSETACGNDIVTLSVKWLDHEGEMLDPEGNVWKTCQLKVSPNITSTYGDKEENFFPRVECLEAVKSLIEEIREMVPGSIRAMILDNEGRISRDLKRKNDEICDKIAKKLSWEYKEARRALRVGGRSRSVSREIFKDIESGSYTVVVNDGSHKSPKYKKYFVVIPENPVYLVAVKRIE